VKVDRRGLDGSLMGMESVLKGFWSLHGLYEHMLIHANVLDNCFESMLSFLFYSLLFLWVWGGGDSQCSPTIVLSQSALNLAMWVPFKGHKTNTKGPTKKWQGPCITK
jgi:hypothetical protein